MKLLSCIAIVCAIVIASVSFIQAQADRQAAIQQQQHIYTPTPAPTVESCYSTASCVAAGIDPDY